PYARHTDGLGGATSSTSKVVIVSRSLREDCDVEFLFGAVSIDQPLIDWSGNCGNLSAAVGPFALMHGMVPGAPRDGMAQVRIWQANIRKHITAHVPVAGGQVVEDGDYQLDGVAFPGAEIRLDFHDPAGAAGMALLPTGRATEMLEVPGIGSVPVSCINAGNPTVLVEAARLGIRGTELPAKLNLQPEFLARCEAVRAHAAVRMGLAASATEATDRRPGTPKLALLSAPAAYLCSDGRNLPADAVDLVVRMLSMGAVHHAVPGTGAIALAVAAALPGTLAHQLARPTPAGRQTRIGHPSGLATVAAQVRQQADGQWHADTATLSRTARCLMRGEVLVPARIWDGTVS
ncbi:MAG TPA: PrpF domain-containing protein, partial [Burkholderiaceae bacterium]